MSQLDLRPLADELERDVAAVMLAPPAAVRRRGDARRTRRLVVGAVAVIAMTGAGTATAVRFENHQTRSVVAGAPAGLRVSVFYRDGATAAQRARVEAELRTFQTIGDVLFETREEAYARFKEAFRDHPDLVVSTKPDALPQSERLILADPADFDELKQRVETFPGVDEVVNSSAIGFP